MSQLPSLLDDATTLPAAEPKPVRRPIGSEFAAKVRARFADPVSGPKLKKRAKIVGGILAAGVIGTGIWFAIPRSQPDYMNDSIDEVFDYTLLTDDFNSLSVDERLRLLGQLISRMKGMSSDDSVLMAAFVAGIAGQAREQLEENASRLVIDVWDKYAVDYAKVPEEEREEYLEKTFLEFTTMMETLAGTKSDKTDEQKLADVRRQAARDKERMTGDGPKPPGEALGTVFSVMNGNVGGHASPQQRKRGAQMMRDMIRHFRGQDPSTGKPSGGG